MEIVYAATEIFTNFHNQETKKYVHNSLKQDLKPVFRRSSTEKTRIFSLAFGQKAFLLFALKPKKFLIFALNRKFSQDA